MSQMFQYEDLFSQLVGCIINYYMLCQHEQLFITMMDLRWGRTLSIKIGDTFVLCCSGPWLKSLTLGVQLI